MADSMSVGTLREAIIYFCDLGGVLGQNLSETKEVFIRVGDTYLPLVRVSVAFIAYPAGPEGVARFALVLDTRDKDQRSTTQRTSEDD